MQYTQHPLSAAFPSMDDADFQALKDDIENEGQREPVIILDGMVLDGWHRYRACIDLGIKPTQFTFSDNDDPVAFVKSHNLHRRHLTGSQRAAAVIACSEWAPPNRLKNKQTPGVHLPKTNAQLAAEAHVSPVTIKDAKAAQRAGLGDVVKDGAMTAKEAAKIARGAPVAQPVHEKKPAPTTEEPEYTELDAKNDQINGLQDALAVATMGDVSEDDKQQAASLIAELRAQIKILEATLRVVTISRDTLQNENAAMKKQMQSQREEIKKLKG